MFGVAQTEGMWGWIVLGRPCVVLNSLDGAEVGSDSRRKVAVAAEVAPALAPGSAWAGRDS